MMIRSTAFVTLACLAGCTYNDYHNYGAGSGGAGPIGASGEGGAGATRNNGGDAGRADTAGSAGASGSGVLDADSGTPGPGDGCTGCLRLEVPPNVSSNLQLEFDNDRNLADTAIVWRVRVKESFSSVYIEVYAENEDPSLSVSSSVELSTASGSQDVGLDLGQIDDFRPSSFIDAGGFGGGGFDPGFPFDKTRIQRIGMRIQPLGGSGIFTPAQLEVESLGFSNRPAQNEDFSKDDGDVVFVDSEGAELTHVPL